MACEDQRKALDRAQKGYDIANEAEWGAQWQAVGNIGMAAVTIAGSVVTCTVAELDLSQSIGTVACTLAAGAGTFTATAAEGSLISLDSASKGKSLAREVLSEAVEDWCNCLEGAEEGHDPLTDHDLEVLAEDLGDDELPDGDLDLDDMPDGDLDLADDADFV